MGRFGTPLSSAAARPIHSRAARRGRSPLPHQQANTRVFDVALPGAQMKLVGGDSGRFEREELVDSVILAPSERVVIDVPFRSREN